MNSKLKIQRWTKIFVLGLFISLWVQCARRGTPTGGPKDLTPPVLLRTDPDPLTKNFTGNSIKFYFDEYVKLKDLQNQLIVSPPLLYPTTVDPQGTASKTITLNIQDTLRPNATYTINFGQAVEDHNEGNKYNNLSFVFSTGETIDSLSLSGIVTDAFERDPEDFISVMLYEIDTAYTDSTIYKKPPNYLTNTLDSLPIYNLNYLKEGKYFLFALKDKGKKNVFNPEVDKIAFLKDTITLPTDSIYALTLFKEVPDFSWSVPNYVAKNKIFFGYRGLSDSLEIETLTPLPDSVQTMVRKEIDKDSLIYWIQPTDLDSLMFVAKNNLEKTTDTFTVKTRKLPMDSLTIRASHGRKMPFLESFYYQGSTPITAVDTSQIRMMDKDSLSVPFSSKLDTLLSRLYLDFEKKEEAEYEIQMLPNAITDFFGMTNDTLVTKVTFGKQADYGTLILDLNGAIQYPVIIQLISDRGEIKRAHYLSQPKAETFSYLEPGNYGIRVIFDENGNGKWDTGDFLNKLQPERIVYYPDQINVRANWELPTTFTITN